VSADESAKPARPSVTIEYDFGPEDLAAWHRYYLKSSPGFRRNHRFQTVLWTVVFVSVATAQFLNYRTWMAAAIAYGLTAFCSILVWLSYDLTIERGIRAFATDPQHQGGFGRVQLTLSEEGLREVTPVTDTLVKWSLVTGVIVDKDRIFIRLSSGQAAVINARSYSGPVPFRELTNLVNDFWKGPSPHKRLES
jgi:hypothetical protein